MIWIPDVYSEHALLQQNATLTVSGLTDAPRITLSLTDGDKVVSEASADAADGRFSLSFDTPAASLRPHTLTLSGGTDTLCFHDILIGELWLTTGQSNMEFVNNSMPEVEAYLAGLGDIPIRVFRQDYPEKDVASDFPRYPSPVLGGHWLCAQDTEGLHYVSALGTAFLKEMNHYFRSRMPFGILNAVWGGTSIFAWIPETVLCTDASLLERARATHILDKLDAWNKQGDLNYQQVYAMYNLKIAPLLGVKIRGILWYQGESDVKLELEHRIYADMLRLLRASYAAQFAADPHDFMMISTLIYPWAYGPSGSTRLGYVNQALVETAIAEPHKFAFMPICDLSPIWSYHQRNYPIHPANKYEVGYRMALLAETNCYNRGSQRTPATLESCEAEGDSLILRFRHASSGLRVVGDTVHALYIAGADQVYMPAQCEILAPDTLRVYHPYLPSPKNAAYAFGDMIIGANLFAGEFPLAPFATDPDHYFLINEKLWLDLTRQSVWAYRPGAVVDTFMRPIWRPVGDTEVCFDTAFTQSGVSLRLESDTNPIAVSVRAELGHALDLQNYAGLTLHLLNAESTAGTLQLYFAGEEAPLSLPIVRGETLSGGWCCYSVDFGELPAAEIRRMEFRFETEEANFRFINMEALLLRPKNA